jgi:hypothetical protein
MTGQNNDEYLSAVLKLYLDLPETPSRASPNDRKSAAELHARGTSLATVESALLLASMRRLARSPDMPPLSPIRSLAYFFPVIDEVLASPLPESYLDYLRRKVELLIRRRRIN